MYEPKNVPDELILGVKMKGTLEDFRHLEEWFDSDGYLVRVEPTFVYRNHFTPQEIFLVDSVGYLSFIYDDGEGPILQGKVNGHCKITDVDLANFKAGMIPKVNINVNYSSVSDFLEIRWPENS